MYDNKQLYHWSVLVILGLDHMIQHVLNYLEYVQKNELVSTIYNTTTSMNDVSLICLLIHGGTLAFPSASDEYDAIIWWMVSRFTK